MTERNILQKANPHSHSQSGQFQTQPEVHELESPPPSYEAALTGADGRNQERQAQSHNLNQHVGAAHFWGQQQEQQHQLEQERQQRQLEQQRRQQKQQQAYPIQGYSSSNKNYEPDAKYPVTNQQDYPDLEAQRPTVASSSGQVQTDPRDRRRHGCQHEDGKQRPVNCCVACFGGCAACCYCCVVM